MREQGKALIEYMFKEFGVKIKITKFPGYNERGSGGFGFDTVNFNYSIEKVVEPEKLKMKTSDIDFVEKLIWHINAETKSFDKRAAWILVSIYLILNCWFIYNAFYKSA